MYSLPIELFTSVLEALSNDMVKILVERGKSLKGATIGKLTIPSKKYTALTLEDEDRGLLKSYPLEEIVKVKVKNETAIPKGTYKLVLDYSNRFKRIMPHILDVPGFDGVRIHSGNKKEDTEGCILLGKTRVGDDRIADSRVAYAAFMAAIAGENNIEITII